MSFIHAGGKRLVGRLDKAIAGHVIDNSIANPDLTRRRWHDALVHNLGFWEGQREFRSTPNPFESALRLASSSGGMYCEGLVMLPAFQRPEPAIWVDLPDKLVCFTHNLEGVSHGIQGFPMPDSAVNHLRFTRGVMGGYLFNTDLAVANMLIPWFVRARMDGAKPSLQ